VDTKFSPDPLLNREKTHQIISHGYPLPYLDAEIGGPPGRQDLSCSFLVRSNAAGAGSPRLIKKLILFFYPAHSDFFLSFYADFSTKSVVTDGSQRVLKPWVCHLAGGRVRMTEARTRSA
jgi:hypothetical protein